MKNHKGEDYITESKIDKLPDPKLHQQISFVKSGVRIVGYAAIPFWLLQQLYLY